MKLRFWQFFIILVLLDIIVGCSNLVPYRYVTKPLILVSLLTYFAASGRHLPRTTYILMILALLLSLMGDVFLLFDSGSDMYFMMGLASFLIAHLLYGVTFLKKRNSKTPLYLRGFATMLVLYGGLLFFYLVDDLGPLTYPVLAYILGILFMSLTASWRFKKVSVFSYVTVFMGALCFIASDSILAINMFKFEVPWSSAWIMASYAAAQYFITIGILREGDSVKNLSTLS